MEQSFPKRRHIKFRRRGITQKKEYNKVLQYCEGVQECKWRFARHDTLSLTSITRSQSQKNKTCTRQRGDWSLWLVFLSCNKNFILGRLVAMLTRVFYLLETGHMDLKNLAAQMRDCACIWEAIQAVLIELPRTTFHFDADKFNDQSFYGLFIFCWPFISLQILGNNQLDALFHVFISCLYMFRETWNK